LSFSPKLFTNWPLWPRPELDSNSLCLRATRGFYRVCERFCHKINSESIVIRGRRRRFCADLLRTRKNHTKKPPWHVSIPREL
jgi:hypothetical protein